MSRPTKTLEFETKTGGVSVVSVNEADTEIIGLDIVRGLDDRFVIIDFKSLILKPVDCSIYSENCIVDTGIADTCIY